MGVLLAAAVLVAVALVWRQLPDRGTPSIPGLTAPVEVTFDARAIPTVRAHSMGDALRVQGYLQARERLLQMELGRRVAGGEVAELVGAAALPLDRRQRVFGFAQVAETAVERLPPAERAAAEALADGINAFITSHRGRWGLEFELLGAEPRAWKPADSIRMLLLMHQQLSSTWESDLETEALSSLPAERRAFLQPMVTAEDVLVLPDATPPPAPSTSALLTAAVSPSVPTGPRWRPEPLEVLGVPLEPLAGARPPEVGSNAWVVSGAHTAKGKPLLANDPHLGFSAPEVWYPLRIELLGRDGRIIRWVQGVSLPGIPGTVIFQNDRLAIGFTNTGTDVQDLYREPAIAERVERIAVKDGPTEVLTVSAGQARPDGASPGLAVQWAALDPSTLRLPVEAMMLATDWASLNAGADQLPRARAERDVRRRCGPHRLARASASCRCALRVTTDGARWTAPTTGTSGRATSRCPRCRGCSTRPRVASSPPTSAPSAPRWAGAGRRAGPRRRAPDASPSCSRATASTPGGCASSSSTRWASSTARWWSGSRRFLDPKLAARLRRLGGTGRPEHSALPRRGGDPPAGVPGGGRTRR